MKYALRICSVLVSICCCALAQPQYKVLYNFHGVDGDLPQSLIFDQSGNLYGTTAFGGTNSDADCNSHGCGTIFQLSPNSDGTWSESVLYDFCAAGPHCQDGYNPNSGLVFDAAGNLYGTTLSGGPYGWGEVFELSPQAIGPWSFNILYYFCPATCSDGKDPSGALAIDAGGNLYGTTSSGGNNFSGTVFELSPPAAQGGSWTETVLYAFCTKTQGKACLDGNNPIGGVTFDSLGNLIGTTAEGGQYRNRNCNDAGCGTVFKLSPSAGGWVYTLLNAPIPSVGFDPLAPVVTDASGAAYGTFAQGGKNGDGALFKVLLNGQHSSIPLIPADGTYPSGDTALVLGANAIYGSAAGSGSDSPGTIFQITSSGQENVLYRFCSQSGCADGESPLGLTSNNSGALYGVAAGGGTGNSGVVFELEP